MNTHDKIELPPLPTIGGLQEAIKLGPEYVGQLMQSYALAAIKPYEKRIAELEEKIEADRKHRFENGKALRRYKECGGDEEKDPIERLRFYCSLAMSGQDWLDVQPFFDDLVADHQHRGEQLKVSSAISKLIDRIEQSAPMDVAGRGKYLHDLRALLARYGQPTSNEERGFLTITWDEDKIAAITRQDSEGKILSVIAVSGNPPFNPKEIKPCGF